MGRGARCRRTAGGPEGGARPLCPLHEAMSGCAGESSEHRISLPQGEWFVRTACPEGEGSIYPSAQLAYHYTHRAEILISELDP